MLILKQDRFYRRLKSLSAIQTTLCYLTRLGTQLYAVTRKGFPILWQHKHRKQTEKEDLDLFHGEALYMLYPWCFFCLPVGALLLQRPSEDLYTTHRFKERLGWFLQFTSHKLKTLYAIKPDQSVSRAI